MDIYIYTYIHIYIYIFIYTYINTHIQYMGNLLEEGEGGLEEVDHALRHLLAAHASQAFQKLETPSPAAAIQGGNASLTALFEG